MRSTPGWGDPKAPLPPKARVATPTATFEFPFAWTTLSVPDSDWLVEGSEGGAGQVTEIGTSMPSDARVAGEPTETAMPESADTATGRSPSNTTGVSAPNRRSRLNIIGHLIEAMAGTAQIVRGKPSQSQSHQGFKIVLKERDLTYLVSAEGTTRRREAGETPTPARSQRLITQFPFRRPVPWVHEARPRWLKTTIVSTPN